MSVQYRTEEKLLWDIEQLALICLYLAITLKKKYVKGRKKIRRASKEVRSEITEVKKIILDTV